MILWIDEGHDGDPKARGFNFASLDATKLTYEWLSKINVEIKSGQKYDKFVSEDPEWAQRASTFYAKDTEMDDVSGKDSQGEDEFLSANDESRSEASADPYADEIFTENMQAFSYNRDFMLKGPVVQVYSRDEDTQKPRYEMTFPRQTDADGNSLNPYNLILSNEESNLIYGDSKNRMDFYNQDLNTGQVVETFNAGDREVVQMSNPTKNG